MRLYRLLATGNHERLARGFDHQYRHDRAGVWLLLVFGLCWCFLVSWPITIVEFAAAPLYFYGGLRLTNTWRIMLVFLTRPLVLLVLAWCLWNVASFAWTPDVQEGWNDLSKFRFFIAAAMLWPVMDRRPWLIAALAAGFLAGNAIQFLTFAGAEFEIAWLKSPQAPDRFSGWWKPAVAGSLLVGVLGLHLPAAFMGRGRTRWLGIGGSAVTILGLVATGTRGGWIAGAALVAITGAVAIGRAVRMRVVTHSEQVRVSAVDAPVGASALGAVGETPRSRARPVLIGLAALVGLAGLVLAWRTVAPAMLRRIEFARAELWSAWEKGDYSSFTGQRLLMADLAVEAFLEHPIGGLGVGGFRAWTTERRREDPRAEFGEAREREFPHAHNGLLHAAATTGLPGLLLSLAVMWVAIRGGLNREQLGAAGLGSYAAGPGFALIGLFLVSAFDTIQVNAVTVALISTLFVMCLLPPPKTPERVARRA